MPPRSSRSYASIFRANTLTIPNGILLAFGVLTLSFGLWQDALFLGILVSNIAIGSFQEIRSKRALDRLAALVAPEAVVAAIAGIVDRRTNAGVVSAAGNRRAIRIAQEPLDTFRRYMAVFAREQAHCYLSPSLVHNLERHWDAARRRG